MKKGALILCAVAVLAFVAAPAIALTETWTGANSNQAGDAGNWNVDPNDTQYNWVNDVMVFDNSSYPNGASSLVWTGANNSLNGTFDFSRTGGFNVAPMHEVPATVNVLAPYTYTIQGSDGGQDWQGPCVYNIVPNGVLSLQGWALNRGNSGALTACTINGGGALNLAPELSCANWGSSNGFTLNNGSILNAVIDLGFELNNLGGNGTVNTSGGTTYLDNASTFSGTINVLANTPGVPSIVVTSATLGAGMTLAVAAGGTIQQATYYDGARTGPNTKVATFGGCTLAPAAGAAGPVNYWGNLQFAKNAGQNATLGIAVVGTGGQAGVDFSQLNVQHTYLLSPVTGGWVGDTDGVISSASSATNALADASLVVNITRGLTPHGITAPGQAGDPFAGQTLTILTASNDLSAATFGTNIKFVGGFATVNYTSAGITLTNIFSDPALAGDINNDGLVDVADYNIWAANVGKTGATWAQGDLNGDGLVDVADYNIWAANVGKTAATPEPISMIILAIGGGLVALRRNRDPL
jgi:hypothetical protein